MDETSLIIIVVVCGFVLLFLYIKNMLGRLSESTKPSEDLLKVIDLLQEGSKEDRKVLLESLAKNTQSLNQRLDTAARVIGEVQRNVGEMSEIGRGMKDLQDFLKSPKLRGNIGEQVLKDLISQMFPKNQFMLQHTFKSGYKVDAAIKTAAGILPIDSKFPMENFQAMSSSTSEQEKDSFKKVFIRDIKKHISDISNKYILPEEGTMDFALMYMPSEAVYYEVVNETELMKLAQNSRVYPVSPSTLYAHLQTILLSFEGQKLDEEAKRVIIILRAAQKDYEKVEGNLSILQKHLNNAYNIMSSVLTSFNQLGQKLMSAKTLSGSSQEEKRISS